MHPLLTLPAFYSIGTFLWENSRLDRCILLLESLHIIMMLEYYVQTMLFETGRICYKNDVNIVQVFFQLYYFWGQNLFLMTFPCGTLTYWHWRELLQYQDRLQKENLNWKLFLNLFKSSVLGCTKNAIIPVDMLESNILKLFSCNYECK